MESASARPGDVARVLDGGPSGSRSRCRSTGSLRCARDLRGLHHAASAAIAESPRHEDAVCVVEQRGASRLLERFRLDPLDVDLEAMREASVIERFVEALVRVLVADVLPDDVDRDLIERVLDSC